jgi:hypothetical protein
MFSDIKSSKGNNNYFTSMKEFCFLNSSVTFLLNIMVKVKVSRNRPGGTQRVPEGLGSQIS